MLIAIFDVPGILHAEETLMPGRGKDEVLARAQRVGACGADLHVLTGKQPYHGELLVMGHEFYGIAEQAPQVSRQVAGLPCGGSDGDSSITGGIMAGHNHAGKKKFLLRQIREVM